jgi:hypothetical protein
VKRDFWEGLFRTGDTRFDLGGPTIALFDWLDAHPLPAGKALVPGCGRGYDVIELAQRGWDALGVDFAPSALSDARRLAAEAGVAARFEERDFFDLEGEALYDLWWENTCYCAVDPRRRDEYAQVAARLVRRGGMLLFLAFPIGKGPGGPPFLIDPEEIGPRFAPHFGLREMGPPPRPSAAKRAGREFLAVLERA